MERLGELSALELRTRLRGDGVRVRVGPYVYAIQSKLSLIEQGIKTLYADFPLAEQSGFADFHISLGPASLIHRLRGKLEFYFDNQRPFNRIEARHAYAFLEWGMNWCVSVCVNEYLKLHAAVVSRNSRAIIMPGLPGSGKSTLCAAMGLTGWRVLSDEHALIPFASSQVVPLYRPVSLKNESIPVIKSAFPDAVLGPQTNETHKGIVAHLKADLHPDSHASRADEAVLMVFPQYDPEVELEIESRTRAESFIFAGHHSFNYSVLNQTGFDTLASLIDSVECVTLRYRSLEQGLNALDQLHRGVYGA